MSIEPTTNSARAPLGVVVDEEREGARGWSYAVTVSWKSMGTSEHVVTLSWVDHDQLTGGTMAPSRLVERVAGVVASAMGYDEMPAKFDVSSMRRAIPEFERMLNA